MTTPIQVDLTGKTAVVTGGSGVLCSEMAKALAASGANLAILGRRQEAADAVAADIQAAGGQAIGISCDVMQRSQLENANKQIQETFGTVDILINGAGGNHPDATTGVEFGAKNDLVDDSVKSFFKLEEAGFQHVFNLNLLGTLLPTQVFSHGMVEQGSGTIINVSSMAADLPLTKVPGYSAAKAAIDNFTRWLAVHMSQTGVRVNAIAPGFFLAEQNKALLTNEDGSLTPRGEKIVNQTPMGRFGSAPELLGVLLWLASEPASSFVTGIVVPVDGGFSAYSGV